MKNLMILACLYLTINICYGQGSWSKYDDTSIRGSISGSITQGHIFKTSSREYFIIDERTRQRVRVRNPDVEILRSGSTYKLIIEDFDEPVICKKIQNVIETQIEGEFEGWEGENIFKMTNGQTWQQSSYAYLYHYAYRPEVIIYKYKGAWIMRVENVDETIEVMNLE